MKKKGRCGLFLSCLDLLNLTLTTVFTLLHEFFLKDKRKSQLLVYEGESSKSLYFSIINTLHSHS